LLDLGIIAVTFGTIFLVELPDKTFIAALVLSTRYPGLAVWLGVGSAFLVQTIVAVTAGALATLLPTEVLTGIALAIFLVGAIVLVRSAPGADAEEKEQEAEFEAATATDRTFWSATGASFLLLFAAEWGDLSQLLTISLVTKYHDHVNVFLGAWGALLVVSGLAVIAGRWLLGHLRLRTIHYAGALVCLVLAGISGVELVSAL
jgi:putative Ca2+/H+ antiporter (TMEM165/GDT1 family)